MLSTHPITAVYAYSQLPIPAPLSDANGTVALFTGRACWSINLLSSLGKTGRAPAGRMTLVCNFAPLRGLTCFCSGKQRTRTFKLPSLKHLLCNLYTACQHISFSFHNKQSRVYYWVHFPLLPPIRVVIWRSTGSVGVLRLDDPIQL
jgi:hypothetical protein